MPSNNSWGNTTSPYNHNDKEYTYIVHAINGDMSGTPYELGEELDPKINHVEEKRRNKEAHDRNRLMAFHNPDLIGNRIAVSTSYINQLNNQTYGVVRYILNVPASAIISCHETNANSKPWILSEMNAEAERGRTSKKLKGYLDNPRSLLEDTGDSWNEVLVWGSHKGQGEIRVVGIFTMMDSQGNVLDWNTTKILAAVAAVKGLPVVKIKMAGASTGSRFGGVPGVLVCVFERFFPIRRHPC